MNQSIGIRWWTTWLCGLVRIYDQGRVLWSKTEILNRNELMLLKLKSSTQKNFENLPTKMWKDFFFHYNSWIKIIALSGSKTIPIICEPRTFLTSRKNVNRYSLPKNIRNEINSCICFSLTTTRRRKAIHKCCTITQVLHLTNQYFAILLPVLPSCATLVCVRDGSLSNYVTRANKLIISTHNHINTCVWVSRYFNIFKQKNSLFHHKTVTNLLK